VNKKISFIGLGKLGLPLATNFAKNNIDVQAIDINPYVVDCLNNNKAPFFEPHLQKNIEQAKDNISYSLSYDDIEKTDTTVILVNTPSNKKDGSFSNLYIEKTLETTCNKIKNKKEYHLFIISSTVMPRSIDDSFIPLIDSITGWELNVNYGICYVPDFVALGTVIRDFENPEMLIVGESSKKAGDLALTYYTRIHKNKPPIKRMNLIEAEIAKVSLNAYICTKISFSNFLTSVCEFYENANVDNITEAIGIDKRIGKHYFKGGLPFGGTCFPRDTWAFIKMSKNIGLSASHVRAAEKINQNQYEKIKNKIIQLDPDSVSILGMGFKNNTPVVTESTGFKLIRDLLKKNIKVHVYDPIEEAIKNTQLVHGDKIKYYKNYEDCVKVSKFCVIINMYDEFESLEKNLCDDHVVFDCWRSFKKLKIKKHIKVGSK